MSAPRCIVDGSSGPLVRRKIVVFRRLEPGDVRTPGTHQMPHSPYLEGLVLDVALSKSFHDDLVRTDKKRLEVLGGGDGSLLHRFDIPGMIIAAGGTALIGSYLGYAPEMYRPFLLGVVAVGVVLAVITRVLKSRADAEAAQRWKSLPERAEHERLGRELAEAWVRFSAQVRREHEGFHTELRVGEGSTAPQRLCSIDPRGFIAVPATFDPEDWLPTVGGGIRYEEVDVMGELVTRGLEGVDDVVEERGDAEAANSAQAADSAAEPDAPTETAPREGKPKDDASAAHDDDGSDEPDAEARPAAEAPGEASS